MKTVSRSLAFALALFLVIQEPGLVHAQEGPPGPVYVVEEGDTLTGIALRFGTTVDALVQANGIADASSIQPGMRLVLPGFEGVSGVLGIHEVAFGESVSSLAMMYGLAPDALEKLNRLVSPGRLYVGQPMVVPQPASGSPTMAAADSLAEGEGLLEASAVAGVNPWLLSGPDFALWDLPGDTLYVVGGDSPPNDLPSGLEEVALDPLPLVQGRTAVLHAATDGTGTLHGSLAGHDLNLVPDDAESGRWVALQGIYALQPTGLADFELRIESQGVERAYQQPVPVVAGGYGREALLGVPADTLDPANTGPEDKEVAQIVQALTQERRWTTLFQFPVAYHDSFPSQFGTRRSYNGSAYSYYHTGLDLYGNPETPVMAPAPGRVVFAGPLLVRGNATYIDHGWGVYSGYLHQSQIFVKPGDLVETGETIGMVGASGRVTGPHLHWEIWVGGVPVNPLEWTERELP
jgi:murein DD-endopeptidase MepM/ murein hydrolase activator NlpD